MVAHPQLAEPVGGLMHYFEMQQTEEGYAEVIRLAKEYLEKTDSKDRRSVLWNLNKIYTDFAYQNNGKNNIHFGKIDELLQYLQELSRRFPDSFSTVKCIANTLIWGKRFAEAVPYLKKYLEEFPFNLEMLIELMKCYSELKEWNNVLAIAKTVFDTEIDSRAALKLQGIAFQELGRFPEAINVFKRFLALGRPFSVDIEEVKARLLLCQKRVGKDVSQISKAYQDLTWIEGGKEEKSPGGIDLTPANMNLQTQNNGGEIKFHINPAMFQQLQNALGFTPEIMGIETLPAGQEGVNSLRLFLGIQKNSLKHSSTMV